MAWLSATNPVIWSSVNTSHFDRTKRIFREDQEFRSWFPVLTADQHHVNNVHDPTRRADAREKFLAASFIAEDLEKAKTQGYLELPWLLATETSGATRARPLTFSLHQGKSGKQVLVRKPGDKDATDLSDILLPADRIRLGLRFASFLDQIMLTNPVDKSRTASCLLRIPAGKITQDYHLIEFYHTFPKLSALLPQPGRRIIPATRTARKKVLTYLFINGSISHFGLGESFFLEQAPSAGRGLLKIGTSVATNCMKTDNATCGRLGG